MDQLAENFNSTADDCINFILGQTNDSDLRFYKKIFDKVLQTDKNKVIEQFIINCLPHKKNIIEKNESYFINLKSEQINVDDKSLFEVLKLRKYFVALEDDVKNLIFEYLILLSNYSEEYFKLKYNIK
jgi:hypothetical protein